MIILNIDACGPEGSGRAINYWEYCYRALCECALCTSRVPHYASEQLSGFDKCEKLAKDSLYLSLALVLQTALFFYCVRSRLHFSISYDLY